MKKTSTGYDPSNPNAHLDLSGLDYNKLLGATVEVTPGSDETEVIGEDFKRYQDFLLEVQNQPGGANIKYDFALLRVKPVYKKRYAAVKGSPVDFIGVELKRNPATQSAIDHPKSRMRISDAMTYNEQVRNEHARVNGKMYFLVLPKMNY